MNCEGCEHWTIRRATKYEDGTEIENWRASAGQGQCASLGIETTHDFGCNRFIETSGDHVEIVQKSGAPFHHFKMIKCPDCGGIGNGGRGHRCAGTGLVRLYDDGFIGDEQTRKHPKEVVAPPTCPGCGKGVESSWAHCPACGAKVWKVAETEVIDDVLQPLFSQEEPLSPVRFEDDFPAIKDAE